MKKYVYAIVIIVAIFLFCTLVRVDEKTDNTKDELEYQIEELKIETDYLKEEISNLESKLEEAENDIDEKDEYIAELEELLNENVEDWDKTDVYLTDEAGNLVIPKENKTNLAIQ